MVRAGRGVSAPPANVSHLTADPQRSARCWSQTPPDGGLPGYLTLTNMAQAAASAAPVNRTTGLSQNVPP